MSGNFVNQARTTDSNKRTGSNIYAGTYVGEVMHNQDPQLAGRVWVFIPEFGGIKDQEGSWVVCSYASPFYGLSQSQDVSQGGPNTTPVSTYGFWAIAPDVGVKVLCTFVNGNYTEGYWFAVIPTVSHGMIPAIGAPDGKTPMSDFNPLDPAVPATEDLTSIERQPYQPLVTQFTTQGINEDPVRGPITSSSFRESPSRVFGISSQATEAAPGHTFVMDDGGEDGTNKLIRIRTSSGNQITMHDDTGMIYLINAQGTGWLELSPSGQIDVYGEAGVNLASKGDINLHAENNVSIHANNCIKIVASNGTKVQGGSELQLHGAKTMIEGVDSLHVHSCTEIMITSFADIHMKAFNYFCLKGKCFYWNSCEAKEAEQVPPEQPQDVSGYQTTVARAPAHEPYKEHDTGQGAAGGAAGGAGGMGDMGGMLGGLGSGTGAGGMFDSLKSGLGGAGGGASGLVKGAMDTAATSLGTGKFSLNFKTGLAGNAPKTSTTASTSVSSGAKPTATSSGGGTSRSTATTSTTKPAASTATTSVNMNAAKPTSGVGAAQTSGVVTSTATSTKFNTIENGNIVATTRTNKYGGMSGIPESTQSTMLITDTETGKSGMIDSTTTANTTTPQNPTGPFGSGNPADQAMTGASPAQDAASALGEMGGMSPSSDLPAAPGGGGTGCFATGDNCERPADETGGGGGGGPNGAAEPEPLSPEEIEAKDKEVYDQLVASGVPPDEAAAITARWKMESGNWRYANAYGDFDGKSYGIAQWRGDRLQRMFAKCGSSPSISCQVSYAQSEPQFSKALGEMKTSSSMWHKTETFRKRFEVAQSISRNDSQVHANANKFKQTWGRK